MSAGGGSRRPRIALLVLDAFVNRRAVRRFIAAHAGDIALVGLSNPYRASAGGPLGQMTRRVRQSGWRIAPYLLVNFALPGLVSALPWRGLDDERVSLPTVCRRRNVPTVPIDDVNGPAFRLALRESSADLIVTFHFDQILSADTIGSVSRGGINVHPSLLPHHRGPTPTIHALLDDPVRLGVTIHRLAPRIDAGECLAQATVPHRPDASALACARLLHDAALPLLDRVLHDLSRGDPTGRVLPILAYRGFPTPNELQRLRRRGRTAAGWRDLLAVFRRGRDGQTGPGALDPPA